ncbi:chemotaxis protein CheD [Marinobacterium sp. YM272]|uniref:chemotaxis protein CheD n=1 Tax=Marinobacterium sp. YM272 TaxID=3421654 RepID=UPI003D7FA335
MKRITLHPGDLHVSSDPAITLSTLLGSCVSACLYDPVNGVFGMNHFLLAAKSYTGAAFSFESQSGRYGINAMELLINDMLAMGAIRSQLKAKVFGGANVLSSLSGGVFAIGDVNARFITSYLQNEKIPVVASDLGGARGRQIHFQGADFSVFVKLLGQENAHQVISRERHYLDKAIHEQERLGDENNVTFL